MRFAFRRSLPAVVGALVALPVSLHAQFPAGDPAVSATPSTRPLRIGFGGGVVVPRTGATARKLRSGLHGQGFVLLQLPAGLPALRANFDYARMRLQPPAIPSLPGGSAPVVGAPAPTVPTPDETLRTLMAGVASLKVDLLRGPVRPYVLAGVGAFRLTDEPQRGLTDATRRQLDFGIEGGAGLSIRLGPIDAFAETRLQNVYTKQKGLIDTKSVRAFPVTFGFTI